jgi:galactokinase
VQAWAPGRVNLMGDHTDQTGGRVLPLAIHLGTSVRGGQGGDRIRLRSSWAGAAGATVDVGLDGTAAPDLPPWGRLAAAVAAEVRPAVGLEATVESTLPVGAGLSSSASFASAVALALGFEGPPLALAELAQEAEHAATGVPCGLMDQLAVAAGVEGHALRIDCHARTVDPVPLPEDLAVLVIHSGQDRIVADTPYGALVADLRAAEAVVGPLRLAAAGDLAAIGDARLRRRARHVVTENGRVDQLASALQAVDRSVAGALLAESHASLRDDLEVSTPALDQLVGALVARPGVVGARLTGAGFGGCVVALVDAGAPVPDLGRRRWLVRAAGGATCDGGGRPSWPGTPPP